MTTKLNLQPNYKESISLASFRSNSAAHKNLPIGVNQVHTETGYKISISVLIVLKIAPPLQNLPHTSLQQVPYLNALQLAYPITDSENFKISVLIGADYYWSFVQDHIDCLWRWTNCYAIQVGISAVWTIIHQPPRFHSQIITSICAILYRSVQYLECMSDGRLQFNQMVRTT